MLPTLKPFKINPFENIVSLSLYLANIMTSVPQLHKVGPLSIALFSSDLRGDASGDLDYAADTHSDDSNTSSDCDSNVSGDENIIAEARAAEAGTANSEERSDDREAADEVEEPCGSEKWYACSCMPSM